MLLSCEHEEKIPYPIRIAEVGMVNSNREGQFAKAKLPILSTPSGQTIVAGEEAKNA